MARHAEISGGGIAGLVVAAGLAKRGWSVRVHERTANLRNFGAGIVCWYNFVRVLKAIGAFDEAQAHARIGRCRETRDHRDRLLWTLSHAQMGDDPLLFLSRGDLLMSIAHAAQRAGAEIVTNSRAVGAEPDGVLLMEDGRRLKADLVVGADGVHSAVRDSLKLVRSRKKLQDVTFRALVRRYPRDNDPDITTKTVEYWSGTRRFFYSFLNEEELFLSFTMVPRDPSCFVVPFPKDVWINSFPFLEDFISRVEDGRWDHVEQIGLHAWSKGRVAIIGDAANAMSPNIGQGGGCASMNALSLSVFASKPGDLAQNLQDWEAQERPLTDFTQKVSAMYSNFNLLPPSIRSPVMKLAGKSSWLVSLRQRPAVHIPTGYVAEAS
jgi:2-polyprenyl-6-methoxyphenol hydroxylase-like FAD-dependent oxidoreductase